MPHGPSNATVKSIPRPPLQKMELPKIRLAVATLPLTITPALFTSHDEPLNATILRAPASVPPTVELAARKMLIPAAFPNGCVPVMSAPTVLPLTIVPFKMSKPTMPLPEMRLPGGVPGLVVSPPMMAPSLLTPTFRLGMAIVPVRSVPMKLPCTASLLPTASPRLLPEIILRAAVVFPPIRLPPLLATPR